MFDKDLKADIKNNAIKELLNEYNERKEKLESECESKYKEYRKIRTELELINFNINELENNDFNSDTEVDC